MLISSSKISEVIIEAKKEYFDKTKQTLERLIQTTKNRPDLQREFRSMLNLLLVFEDKEGNLDYEALTFEFFERWREEIRHLADPLSLNGEEIDEIEVAA